MSTNDYIADVTANLTEWGITYRETTEGAALVVDGECESPMRVINVETAEDTTHWSMGDVAAAALSAIA